jgi:regulator-associated protein of mTOR
LIDACIPHLNDPDPLLRQWICICLSHFWIDLGEAKWLALQRGMDQTIVSLLEDPVPEVRAAAILALGSLLSNLKLADQNAQAEQFIISKILFHIDDPSPLVRKELVFCLSNIINESPAKYVLTATELIEEERIHHSLTLDSQKTGKMFSNRGMRNSQGVPHKPLHTILWKALLVLSVDPFELVSKYAKIVVDKVTMRALMSKGHADGLLSKKPISVARVLSNSSLETTTSTNGAVLPVISSLSQAEPSLRKSASLVSIIRKSLTAFVGSEDQPARLDRMRPVSMVDLKSSLKTSENYLRNNNTDMENLSLESDFFEWSRQYFRESQTRAAESDDPGSVKYIERDWRKHRNNKIIYETSSLYAKAGSGKFEENRGIIFNGTNAKANLLMHPYSQQIIASDDSNITVFDDANTVHMFPNKNPEGSKISSLLILNPEDDSLLLSGSGKVD